MKFKKVLDCLDAYSALLAVVAKKLPNILNSKSISEEIWRVYSLFLRFAHLREVEKTERTLNRVSDTQCPIYVFACQNWAEKKVEKIFIDFLYL